jgi:hypothetical protein
MTDVFEDFLVVIEGPDGTRRGSLTPDEFRVGMGCLRTTFRADCIERWNASQAAAGLEDRARLEMRTRPSRSRSSRSGRSGR